MKVKKISESRYKRGFWGTTNEVDLYALEFLCPLMKQLRHLVITPDVINEDFNAGYCLESAIQGGCDSPDCLYKTGSTKSKDAPPKPTPVVQPQLAAPIQPPQNHIK